ITEVALARVTDDFIAYIRAAERAAAVARAAGDDHPGWDLGTASEFLVVAATLLDLKAARLLPTGSVEDDEDLALLEARDLLFARLLQYRAYKDVSGLLAERFESAGRRFPRVVQLEPHLAALLPELVWT
ncbi:segregation and condensation protein A, partial [Streptococcus pneumoniae]|uniref:segregation and condensation protein A n=2 Tax=Bacillati TaxID=1783272 RepID=UPI0022E4158B